MNFSFYKPTIFQDQEFMDKQGNNFTLLNFSGHEIKPNFYPTKYKVIDLPMNVNINVIDLDIQVYNFVFKTIQDVEPDYMNKKPIIIFPKYYPIQMLVYHIVSEIFSVPYPITVQISSNEDGEYTPSYFVPMGLRKRIRPKRNIIQNLGLVIE